VFSLALLGRSRLGRAACGGGGKAACVVSIGGMRFSAVLFDLDGTLVDSAQIILNSFHHTTETVLQRRFPDEQILAQVEGILS